MIGVTDGTYRQCLLVGLLLALATVASPVFAEKRVAFVIGNGAYKAQDLLINPLNDVRLIGQALTRAQFAWGKA